MEYGANAKGRLKLYLGANPRDFSVGKVQTQTASTSVALHGNIKTITHTAGDCLARTVLVTANHSPHACRLLVDRLSHSVTFRPMYVRVRGTLLGIYLGLAYQLEFPLDAVCLRLFSILLTPTRLKTGFV